jgi:hypothetical protein
MPGSSGSTKRSLSEYGLVMTIIRRSGRSTGGSVPAQIWRRFVEATGSIPRSRPEIAAEQMTPTVASEERVVTEGRGTAADAAMLDGLQCDVRACAQAYDSFRVFRLYLPAASRPAETLLLYAACISVDRRRHGPEPEQRLM